LNPSGARYKAAFNTNRAQIQQGAMVISTGDVINVFNRVFRQEIDIDLNVSILDSGLKLESLRLMRALVEIQDLLGHELPLEDAFELFSLSINQFVERLNSIKPALPTR
jgi:acyl carrier protein